MHILTNTWAFYSVFFSSFFEFLFHCIHIFLFQCSTHDQRDRAVVAWRNREMENMFKQKITTTKVRKKRIHFQIIKVFRMKTPSSSSSANPHQPLTRLAITSAQSKLMNCWNSFAMKLTKAENINWIEIFVDKVSSLSFLFGAVFSLSVGIRVVLKTLCSSTAAFLHLIYIIIIVFSFLLCASTIDIFRCKQKPVIRMSCARELMDGA